MNTFFNQISFFSLFVIILFSFSSCSEEEIAKATITVVEEQIGQQGQVVLVPVAQATVKLYSDRQGTDHITTYETAASSGMVSFEYPYEAILWVTATLGSRESSSQPVYMKPGELDNVEVILPQ